MSLWNERIYNYTEKTKSKAEAILSKAPVFWNQVVDEIEEDNNIAGVFTDELRFKLPITDEQIKASKTRALKIINNKFKAIYN